MLDEKKLHIPKGGIRPLLLLALSKADQNLFPLSHAAAPSFRTVGLGRRQETHTHLSKPPNQTASLAGCEILIFNCAEADRDTQGTQRDTVRCCGLAAEENVSSRMRRPAVWLADPNAAPMLLSCWSLWVTTMNMMFLLYLKS